MIHITMDLAVCLSDITKWLLNQRELVFLIDILVCNYQFDNFHFLRFGYQKCGNYFVLTGRYLFRCLLLDE